MPAPQRKPGRWRKKTKRKNQTKGVFCLEESGWFGVKDKTTVEPVLRLLETGRYGVPYLHHDVGTLAEFHYFLEKWTRPSFDSHPILYLGFHGTCRGSGILVGEGENNEVKLTELAKRLKGCCRGRVIHFSSCRPLRAREHALDEFVDTTGVLAVCGFTKDVDWLESAAFDVLVLGRLQGASFLRRDSMRKFERELNCMAPGLYRRLGFRMWYGSDK